MIEFIYLLHVLFVGPLLMYSGYKGLELAKECNKDKFNIIFQLLAVIGLVVLLYHGYKYAKFKDFM